MRLEALERRDCPAVQAFFTAGILTVTGDEGPNDIEFVQRSDGAVEVLGDGEKHTFEGVNKIVARTGAGDDRVSGKIVLWVRDEDPNPSPNTLPFTLDLDTGAGNDTAWIEDDILITFRDLNDPRIRNLVTTLSMDAHVDLGTGADEFSSQLEHHDQVDLVLTAEDGGDHVAIEMLPLRVCDGVGACTGNSARMSLKLGGGDNVVDVQTQGVDVVDLNVVIYAGRAPSNPTGNTIYVSASGGGVWLPAGQEFRPAAARMKMELGGADNVVEVRTEDIDDVTLDLLALGGNNVVKHELGQTLGFRHEHIRPESAARANVVLGGDDNIYSFKLQAIDTVDLDLDLTGNNNQVAIGALIPAVQKVREAAARIDMNVDGRGNLVEVQAENIDDVDLDASLSGGDNRVAVDQQCLVFFLGGIPQNPTSHAKLMLEGDGNQVGFHTQGYHQVGLDLNLTGNGNQAAVGMLLPAIQKVRDAAARVSLEIDGSNNQGTVSNQGYGNWQVNFGRTLPSSDPASASATQGRSIFVISTDRPIPGSPPPTGTVVFTIDGTPQAAPDSDNIEVHGQGFGAATVDADTAGGNDSIWIDIGAPILNVSVDTGAGDDTLVLDAQSAQPFGGFPGGVRVAVAGVNLGEGNDVADIKTQGFSDDSLNLTAGEGNDSVVIKTSDGPGVYKTTDGGATWNVDLDGGDDLAILSAEGFSGASLNLSAGEGNDTVQLDSRAGMGILKSTDGGRTFGTATFTLTLGSGNDRAEINSGGYSQLTSLIDAGDGDDTIVSNSSTTTPSAKPLPVLLVIADQHYNLGAGNDRLVLETSGYGQADTFIDADEGDDDVQVRHRMFAIVDRTQLQIVIHLGAGSDSLRLETSGYRRIETVIGTGPAGDGTDSVFASHQSQRRSTRKHSSRLSLDGGLDLYQHRSKGYRVQGPVQSANSVKWVFVA